MAGPTTSPFQDAALDARLLQQCPLLFRGWIDPDRFTAPLRRHIACGPGWNALIEVLSESLEFGIREKLRDGEPLSAMPAPAQIKERFGELRFDLMNPAPWSLEIVELAVEQSRRLCKDCGAYVPPTGGYSLEASRCSKHRVPKRTFTPDAGSR